MAIEDATVAHGRIHTRAFEALSHSLAAGATIDTLGAMPAYACFWRAADDLASATYITTRSYAVATVITGARFLRAMPLYAMYAACTDVNDTTTRQQARLPTVDAMMDHDTMNTHDTPNFLIHLHD